jgi:hypothetical protein
MIPEWGIWHVVMDGERELAVGIWQEGLDILLKD